MHVDKKACLFPDGLLGLPPLRVHDVPSSRTAEAEAELPDDTLIGKAPESERGTADRLRPRLRSTLWAW